MLILGPKASGTIGMFGTGSHTYETDLADLHPWIYGYGKVGYIRKLEGEVTIESSIDKASRGVYEQSQSSKA
jgi:hypothetical protein